jgi:hypothetical protein
MEREYRPCYKPQGLMAFSGEPIDRRANQGANIKTAGQAVN